MVETNTLVHRLMRPYTTGGAMFFGYFAERELRDKSSFVRDVPATQMREFVQARREAGDRITSFVAYPKADALKYAVVAASGPGTVEWQLEHGLTTEQLKAKSAEFAGQGLRPANVTACPWDGAVRYAAVWVKDPTRTE